jgi:hypothetical protein
VRQVVHISSASPSNASADRSEILAVSQANNAGDGITGLLYGDGRRFLQVIERDDPALERIRADKRHHAIAILSDMDVDSREFAIRATADRRPGDDADQFLLQIWRVVATASPNVRAIFEGWRVRRARPDLSRSACLRRVVARCG